MSYQHDDRVRGMAAILLAQAGGDRDRAIREAREERRKRRKTDRRRHWNGVTVCLRDEKEDQATYERHLEDLGGAP